MTPAQAMPAEAIPAPGVIGHVWRACRHLRKFSPLLIFVLALCAAELPSAAHAHAVLLEAQPADGAALAQAPDEILLRFNEPVTPVSLRLLDANARRVSDNAELVTQDRLLRLRLRTVLPIGTYVVSYRVTSADSHPVFGSIIFTIGAPAKTPPIVVAAASSGWTVVYAVLRALYLGAALLCAGGALAGLMLLPAPRPAQKFVGYCAVCGIALSAALLGSKGAQLVEATASGLFEWASWRAALHSSLATSLAAAVAGMLLLALAPRLRFHAGASVLGGLLVLGSFALTGHAATAAPQWLTVPALLVHVLGAAFWLGALRPLLTALRTAPAPQSALVLTRFSTLVLPLVTLLLAAGLALTTVQLRHFAMLWEGDYGLVLAGKLSLVLVLLALALLNKFVLTPRLPASGDARPLRASIAAEYALFAMILAFTATLTQLEPPRARVERDGQALSTGRPEFVETRQSGDHLITLSVSPARAGHNAFAVKLRRGNGSLASAKEVSLLLALPAAGIEPIRRRMERQGSGDFVYHSNDLAIAGEWQVQAQVLVDDFTEAAVTFTLPLH